MNNKNIVEKIANNITRLRKKEGYTIFQLAEEADINEETLATWSKSKRPNDLQVSNLIKICDVFGCSIDDLVYGPRLELVANNTAPVNKELIINCAKEINRILEIRQQKLPEKEWWNRVLELYQKQLETSLSNMAITVLH